MEAGLGGWMGVSISHPDGVQPQRDARWFNHCVKPLEICIGNGSSSSALGMRT